MEKERRTKALLLSTLVVVVATLSIAFAAMSRTLSINGIGKMDTASWSVYFNDLKGPTIVRGAKQVSAPSISADKGTVQDINVKLSNPKDEISYTVDIVNDGTIDAEITMIKDIELTDAQKKVFEFKVTYTDTGEILQNGDLLPKDTIKKITINIKFKDDITEFDLPTESQTINLSYQLTYTQYDDNGGAIVGPNGGVEPEKKSFLPSVNLLEAPPMLSRLFNGTVARDMVDSISFENNTSVPSEAASTVWDASAEGDNSIIGWYTDNDLNGFYEVYIGSYGKIYAPNDSTNLFGFLINLKEINFNNFNTSEVAIMYGMFDNCTSLTSLDLSAFETPLDIYMDGMFNECTSLTSIDFRNVDFSNVIGEENMFFNVNSSVQVIVKDETQRTWLTSKFTNLTNVVLVSEL